MPDAELMTFTNVTGHGGINTRLSGRLIKDSEFTLLQNVDISIPGKRTKKRAPRTIVTLLPILLSQSYKWQPFVDAYEELSLTQFTGSGIVIQPVIASPDGTHWRIGVDDDGEYQRVTTTSPVTEPFILQSTTKSYEIIVDDNGLPYPVEL